MGKFPSNTKLSELFSFPYLKSLSNYKKLTKKTFKTEEDDEYEKKVIADGQEKLYQIL